MRLEIKPLLTEEQWNLVDTAALGILEKVGLMVPHGEIREILSSKAGIKCSGDVVRFDPLLVQEKTRNAKGCSGYDTHIIAGAYCHNYLDPITNKIRAPTEVDLIKSIKQANALGMGVCAPVVPMDILGPRLELRMERLTREYAQYSYGAGQATSVITAEAGLEMSKLVGRPHGLELWVNSPLKMDEKGLDIVWQLRHLKPDVIICHVPVLGQSAPIFLRGLLAQSAAECFAAMTVLKLLDLGEITYRVDSFAGYSTDMHTGCVLLSGPDYLRLSVLRIESAKRHGIAVPAAKGLLTQAKEPGTQAAAEKATQSLIMEIAGADYHMAAGTLACDDIFSPIQMIIDNELLSFIRTVTKPIDFSVDDFCLDIISEVGPGGTFLDHLSTVRHFREVFWEPGLFSMNTTAKWLSEGKPNLLERAHDILDSLKLSEEPAVSIEVQKELLNIEDKFKKQL